MEETTKKMLREYSKTLSFNNGFFKTLFKEYNAIQNANSLDETIERLEKSRIRKIFGYNNSLLEIAKALRVIIDNDYPDLFDINNCEKIEINIERGNK
jgi:hypothetical protein